MNKHDSHVENQIANGLRKVLNQHGHSFHHSVVGQAEILFQNRRSSWTFDAVEFPVAVKGQDTRIDIIMKQRDAEIYLIAECKRANPALSNWCFVKAPYVNRNLSRNNVLVENIRIDQEGQISSGMRTLEHSSSDVYHISVEVRSQETGDSNGSRRGSAIEDAATQVCRAFNGMTEFLNNHPRVIEGRHSVLIVPVIFTTAHIWVSDVQLNSADLHSGNISEDIGVTKKPWIWYRYHQSPGIKHSVASDEKVIHGNLGKILDHEYARTIAVVSSYGIDDFLTGEWWWNL